MIIWGSKAREHVVERGRFFCPACGSDSNYSKRRVSRYFTLYFIPLFPTAVLAEAVQCERCRAEMGPQVLALSREQIQQMTAPWTCPKCGNRNSSAEMLCLSCGEHRQPVAAAPLLENSTPPALPEPSAEKERPGHYDY